MRVLVPLVIAFTFALAWYSEPNLSPPPPFAHLPDSALEPEPIGQPVEGSRTAPDGVTEIMCDLPPELKKKNINSGGAGCCVFRSFDYAGHWQHIFALFDLPEQMVKAGIVGGGWPEKADKILARFAPGVEYINDTSGDPAILRAILDSGRMACVTYDGHDCHYSGGISHMVNLVCLTDEWACVSDNNFPGENQFVWMKPQEFYSRWKGNGGGWVVCFLSPPPPPPPRN